MGAESYRIELWGGVECTINRVQDRFHDQLKRNQHLMRLADIDRFAELGLSCLRVPVLWEATTPHPNAVPSFAALDPMLNRIRERGMGVIAGLCHHGSGPAGTHLLDPQFEHALARYAQKVAETYPWIEAYTPVNEPLTTARFSALYGHWYPHAADTASFLRALVHQCRAIVRAMQAIRCVQPRARLIQTEDIATVRSTENLTYQAQYENHRRFLSLDLLAGRVHPQHALYDHLLSHGITAAELAWFEDHACVPDVIGINYYFTSDRFLDEDLARHPPWTHGGNGRSAYADIDAARAQVGIVGHREVIQTVWDRYTTPLALTEVHAGCTREEQLRWLHEAFGAVTDAKAAGVDVRALTAWALLGSFDWNSLVCVEAGVYEPGVFDLRGVQPRPTALASMVRSLAKQGHYDHPVLASQGWWRRTKADARHHSSPLKQARPIVITGGRGALAQTLARACELRGLAHRLLTREELDIADPRKAREVLQALSPWAVINAAGYVRIDDAAQQHEHCVRANTLGPVVLAQECQRRGARFLTFSSDLVFDGARREPYVESDAVCPISAYGTSQVEAERSVLATASDAFVVRTSALFGAWDHHNLISRALCDLSEGRVVALPSDSVLSPTYLPHLVDTCLDLLIDGAADVWHLANVGAVTWPAVVEQAAQRARLPSDLIARATTASTPEMALRPAYSVLGSERGIFMPSLDEALEHYVRELRVARPDVVLRSA